MENVFIYIFSFHSVSVEIKTYLAPEATIAAERNVLKYVESECYSWKGHCLGIDGRGHRSHSIYGHGIRKWLCDGL